MNTNLKPQDILILLKLHVLDKTPWTFAELASSLHMSVSEVHQGVKRATAARLLMNQNNHRKPIRAALLEFLVHGVKYAYPVQRASLTRGIPTAYAAPPLNALLIQGEDAPPVWAHPLGTVKGYELIPLYKSVPDAARKDQQLYELLALLDAVRGGRAREKELAARLLKERIYP